MAGGGLTFSHHNTSTQSFLLYKKKKKKNNNQKKPPQEINLKWSGTIKDVGLNKTLCQINKQMNNTTGPADCLPLRRKQTWTL